MLLTNFPEHWCQSMSSPLYWMLVIPILLHIFILFPPWKMVLVCVSVSCLMPCNKHMPNAASYNNTHSCSHSFCGSEILQWLSWVSVAQGTSSSQLGLQSFEGLSGAGREMCMQDDSLTWLWAPSLRSLGSVERTSTLYHAACSSGLRECAHKIATGFLQNEWAKRESEIGTRVYFMS